jgi:hypothetical protein
MRLRNFILTAIGAVALLGATLPASAQEWRRDRHEWREHAWREHEWREHRGWRPGYYAPPTYVAPPAYDYYAPPPTYYGYSPGVNFGVTIR